MVQQTNQNHFYGWVKDEKDPRDIPFLDTISAIPTNLPTSVDLRPKMPLVYNQGNLGSCTANAIAAAVDFARGHEDEFFIYPSRLLIYYDEREIEGTTGFDAGGQIRDGIKSVHTIGTVPEGQWPYDISKFTVKPPKEVYKNAIKFQTLDYSRILDTDINQVRAALATGLPFAFGFNVYASFETPKVAATGLMPRPLPGEQLLGGHAVCAVGYDDLTQLITVRNSWGADWGDKGYFYMPYDFMLSDQTSDFWQIKTTK